MKRIYLNLKRFDVTPERGGVNRLAAPAAWGSAVVDQIASGLKAWEEQARFAAFLPESQLASAIAANPEESPLVLGCQGVWQEDTATGGNFGAFTSLRSANAMAELGCGAALIGHCEERNALRVVLAEARVTGKDASDAVNRILNKRIRAAQAAGLDVLYCIGEREEEQEAWQEVLSAQISYGLEGIDRRRMALAYEPVWSIGPGKTPADAPYIQKIARFVGAQAPGVSLVYGGGLKADNAAMLASIPEIDGGLIALTRFTGEIGFYPEEYLEIIRLYLESAV